MTRRLNIALVVVLLLSVCCLAATTIIDLTRQVTGVLPVANGGTGLAGGTASIHQTAKTASITTATLCASSAGACNAAGMYSVTWAFTQGGTACSSVTAGSVAFLLTWTDTNGLAHSAITMPMVNSVSNTALAAAFTFTTSNATARASGDIYISTNGAVVQYATTYTACTTGTGTYQLDAVVTRLQ